jgi:hypothetical protein
VDLWDSAVFFSSFLASSFFCSKVNLVPPTDYQCKLLGASARTALDRELAYRLAVLYSEDYNQITRFDTTS